MKRFAFFSLLFVAVFFASEAYAFTNANIVSGVSGRHTGFHYYATTTSANFTRASMQLRTRSTNPLETTQMTLKIYRTSTSTDDLITLYAQGWGSHDNTSTDTVNEVEFYFGETVHLSPFYHYTFIVEFPNETWQMGEDPLIYTYDEEPYFFYDHLTSYEDGGIFGADWDYYSHLVLTTFSNTFRFSYDETIADNSWLIMRTPCYADSQTSPTGECGLYPASVGMDLDLTAYIDSADTPAKVDIVTYYFANDFKWVLEPLANESYTYTTSGQRNITMNYLLTVPFSTTTNPLYKTVACIIPPEDSVYFGGEAGQCVTVTWCNGSSDIECGGTMREFGIGGYSTTTNPDGTTVWEELDCDNIGITDVKKGAQCALVWAFAPNDTVTIKWAQVKSHMLSIWPIGYGTLILSDFTDAVTSTSTEYFDNDINVGRWFGRPDAENATITISVAHSVSEMGKFEVFVDYAEKIMWILFAIWVFGFAVTRKL